MRSMETNTTVREQILDHAITLIMLRGYNGFSYRDLSSLVGVKTSSIHYYFPSKDDLVLEAVNEYSKGVLNAIHAIDTSLPADAKLSKYGKLFGRTLGDGDQICLCGCLPPISGRCPITSGWRCRLFLRRTKAGWPRFWRKACRNIRSR